ncbi:hypothetical protein BaRGS_00014612, partial [Batillaria attramentaria]
MLHTSWSSQAQVGTVSTNLKPTAKGGQAQPSLTGKETCVELSNVDEKLVPLDNYLIAKLR